MTRSAARVTSLDGARGFFLLFVFLSHIYIHLFPYGTIVVDLFFVLSGYVITALLLREHDKTGAISIPRFYARRMLRLYPALLVVVVVAFAPSVLEHLRQPVISSLAALLYATNIWSQVGHVTYVEPLLHTWSLAVEEQFYLIWPVALVIALKRQWSVIVVLIVASVACFAVTAAIGHSGWPHLTTPQWLPTAQWPQFMSGALLAVIHKRPELAQFTRRFITWPVALVSIALVMAIAVRSVYAWWMFGGLVVIPTWCFMAHLVLEPDSWLSRAFATRPVVWLGERSYGFYLIHLPVIVLIGHAVHNNIELAAIAFPVTLALTLLSWHFVEMPFLNIKANYATPGVSLSTASGSGTDAPHRRTDSDHALVPQSSAIHAQVAPLTSGAGPGASVQAHTTTG
jgi:peptidoglycan/LPS O-acetylase OafA/YrhL